MSKVNKTATIVQWSYDQIVVVKVESSNSLYLSGRGGYNTQVSERTFPNQHAADEYINSVRASLIKNGYKVVEL